MPPRPFLITRAGAVDGSPWYSLSEIRLCGWLRPVLLLEPRWYQCQWIGTDGNVSVPVSGGLYSIMIGDTQIVGMGEVDESVFQNHNDVHLRVWFSDGVNGFQQTPPTAALHLFPMCWGMMAPGMPILQALERRIIPPSG